ncbi:hypothetical protein L3X38_003140 [Prunus dulcis]|uniref:Uncharacterized protein n=1 Tax=Prunus dulcis TaxID=3755 RepID=A0AAD4ZLH3_PRUDU|nr:hypothetical protein L3X38_003140 [Prunus dulcis]
MAVDLTTVDTTRIVLYYALRFRVGTCCEAATIELNNSESRLSLLDQNDTKKMYNNPMDRNKHDQKTTVNFLGNQEKLMGNLSCQFISSNYSEALEKPKGLNEKWV